MGSHNMKEFLNLNVLVGSAHVPETMLTFKHPIKNDAIIVRI